MSQLTLYYKDGCSFCETVFHFMNDNKISVAVKNTGNDTNRAELIKLGGKSQVPCLVIDGKALYESDDIIQWFKDHRKK